MENILINEITKRILGRIILELLFICTIGVLILKWNNYLRNKGFSDKKRKTINFFIVFIAMLAGICAFIISSAYNRIHYK